MNYKVLYRKYRPDSFESLIGQEHIVSILKNSIKENKIAHAYLFSGPRGTGKTSTARILAKAINCLETNEGLACNKCENCLSYSSNPDIIEIDAASNNGVDEIRELINNVKIMPTSLKYKVYIIDEVHMLSQSAFNALLLTLEEPPEHVIFILATTNIENVPITILSRCQRFDFKRISETNIFERLKSICETENIKYQEEGLKEIAILSDGGLRDALSILDQLSKNNEPITSELVSKEIGSISSKKITELIRNLANNDIEEIENIFLEIQSTNLNYKVLIKKIIDCLSQISIGILKNESDYKLSFDDCKHLVMELNDLMNKITINIDPYLLIKIVILSYIKAPSLKPVEATASDFNEKISRQEEKSDQKSVVKKGIEHKEDKIENKVGNIDNAKFDKMRSTRINNCFINASKSYLIDIKDKWETFISNVNDPFIKGLISDTSVVTASDKYAILVSMIPHSDIELNINIKTIENLFNEFINSEYKLIFISDATWNLEKEKYINNLKNNYKYTYISEEEPVENEQNDLENISDIFDINKIEIE